MPIVFFGTPAFSVYSLKALADAGEKISAVVTRKDKRRERGKRPEPSHVKAAALSMGLRVLEPESLKQESFLGELSGLRPEFLVVVAYGKILPQAVLDVPSVAPVNLHASLLPRYRGAAPIQRAIINGDEETGLTTMLVTAGLDEGDILLQERHAILDDDTALSLSARLAEAGGPLLTRTLAGLRDGSVSARPQTGQPSYAPPLRKDEGRVDWRRTAREIADLARGANPWPGAYCFLEGKRLTLLRARRVDGGGEPGRIISVSAGGFSAGTGGGLLLVEEVRPENRTPMNAADFLRGKRLGEDALLT